MLLSFYLPPYASTARLKINTIIFALKFYIDSIVSQGVGIAIWDAEHLVCMGIYVFEPRVLQFIKSGDKLDIPDLVETLISSGEDVAAFIFDGYWLHISKQDDYEKANAEIEEMYPKLFRIDGSNGAYL